MNDSQTQVHETLAAINRSWRENRASDMMPYLHPEVTMVFAGFTGAVVGRDKLIASFVEFAANARVLEYEESDEQIQVISRVAVASYRFRILYERSSYRELSTGRDIWIFEQSNGKWIAVWRTMNELKEERQEAK